MLVETFHSICQWLRQLIAGTPWEGHVFAVGGCCRDQIMGRAINDIDLAVDVENGGIEFSRWLYQHRHTVSEPVTFQRYGTAMLHLRRWPEHEIELVQTRCGKYTDDNADDPSSVFGTISDDAHRRDFTVNSLFYDISRRQLLDPTGMGIDDIHNQRLRTPMSPDMTFFDDPVRILRCIRLACLWNWLIDNDTMEAMRNGVDGLAEIRPERRRAELEKMLTGPDPVRALELLRTTGAMRYLVPELENAYRSHANSDSHDTLWQRALRAVEQTDADLTVRMAVLLHVLSYTAGMRRTVTTNDPHTERALAGARLAEAALRRLKYHGRFVKEVSFMIRNHVAATRWGNNAERAKDRTLTRLSHLCVTRRRLEQLLDVIHAVNMCAPRHQQRPDQIPQVRARLAQRFASIFQDEQLTGA